MHQIWYSRSNWHEMSVNLKSGKNTTRPLAPSKPARWDSAEGVNREALADIPTSLTLDLTSAPPVAGSSVALNSTSFGDPNSSLGLWVSCACNRATAP
jgi:hypothetical protein